VTKYETWEFCSAILDEGGRCRGITALDLRRMDVHAFPAAAVMLATGGPGIVFGKSTNSQVNTGSAAAVAYQQGAVYANGEFIQVHPTAIPGPDKLRLISESIRGEGGRVWVPREGRPWYFLEDWYPAYGNLVPRDIATRAIFKVVFELGLGVDGQPMVYLDVSHLDPAMLDRKVGGVLEIYEKFAGDDPRKVPMKIFPGMHYSMGGLWVDYDQMTSVPGLFAGGEVDHQFHGANRLGANSLLSCLYSGQVGGPAMVRWARAQRAPEADGLGADEVRRQTDAYARVMAMQGSENAYALAREMGEWMTANVTVIRDNAKLAETDAKLVELKDRWRRVGLADRGRWANHEVSFVKQLWNMLELARVITQGALRRNESRGAHYKPAFPERNDAEWLKTTKARWTPDGPAFTYDPVDVSLIPPRARRYDAASAASGPATGSGRAG
jgi:succinate dehydrogenase / fumarate reductase flavoprotein subunit